MQTMTKKMLVMSLGLTVCTPAAFAAVKPGTPTLPEVLEASGVTLDGYLDTSYTYLSGTGMFVGGAADRVFDREHSSFNLNTFNLRGSVLPASGFGAQVEVNAGSDAAVMSSAGSSTTNVDVTQAYVNYATGPITVMAGKYTTLAGYEVIRSPDNFNFSRGILFGYAVPFTHTGVRVNYTLSDKMKFMAGINNGWDVQKESASEQDKTVELGTALNLIKDLSITAAVYRGDEPGAVPALGGTRTLLDVVAGYNLTPALTVALNLDNASQDDALGAGKDAKWNGLAGYVNFKLNDLWRVAARLEYFNDKDGFRTGVVQKWKEVTGTVAYLPTKNVELRGELRGDRSDKDAFAQTDGGPKKSQQSVALEALYKF